jgi:hypothetical protein
MSKSRLRAAFCIFHSRYKDLVCQHNLTKAKCCQMCSIPIVKPFLTHWFWLPFTWCGSRTHDRCDRFTRDAYSSYAPTLTSGESRGLCLPHSLICISYRTYEIDNCLLVVLFHWKRWLVLHVDQQTRTGLH